MTSGINPRMSLRPPNLGMRNPDRKRVSLPRCPIRTWDCERPLAVEYVRPMRRNIFCMKILLAILLLSPVELLAQSPFDGTWAIVSDTTQFPQKPVVSLLAKGKFRRADTEIKAD